MTIRKKYSPLDMARMAKFAKENPELKPLELIKKYNRKYPEITEEQKKKNIRNYLDDNELIDKVEGLDKAYQILGIKQRVCPYCNSKKTIPWGPHHHWNCTVCGKDFEA